MTPLQCFHTCWRQIWRWLSVYQAQSFEFKIGAEIAFASKVNHMPSYDEERLLRPNAIPPGLLNLRSTFNTLSDNRRFMTVLGSLANLSISEELHLGGDSAISGTAFGKRTWIADSSENVLQM